MDKFCVYLAGGMSGLSFEEQVRWRNQVKDAILYGEYDCNIKPSFFSPPQYYPIEEARHKTEREAMEFDLNALRKSDLVIVNFNAPNSIGTAMELMLAYEHRIPVVGLNKDGVDLHPWLVECTTRICDDMYELVEYVTSYFLNY